MPSQFKNLTDQVEVVGSGDVDGDVKFYNKTDADGELILEFRAAGGFVQMFQVSLGVDTGVILESQLFTDITLPVVTDIACMVEALNLFLRADAVVTVPAHVSQHENGGTDEISVTDLSGELADKQKVAISKNSAAAVGERSTVNFIEGSNITLTIADDSVGDEIDVTIASASGTDPTNSYVDTATTHGITSSDGTVVITSMTLTPGATGDYLCMFSGYYDSSGAADTISTLTIYNNAVADANSVRKDFTTNATDPYTVSIIHKLTVSDAAHAVDVRCAVSSANTITWNERSFTLIKVA